MMIDRPARDRYATLIRDFRDARIDNRQYEDGHNEIMIIYKSKDPAIRAIYSMLWYTYCDVRTHKQEGDHALKPEGKALYDRCIAFLESDEEYIWPEKDFVAPFFRIVLWFILFVVGFGLAGYWLFPVMGVREVGAMLGVPVGALAFLIWFLIQRHRNLKDAAELVDFERDRSAWPFTSTHAPVIPTGPACRRKESS